MPFETAYGLPFAAPLLLGALAWLIAGDYARTQQDLASLNSELTDRVRQKEQALRDSFAKVALLERAQAISNERQRIMRDMHDGVGLHLSSALRQVQGGAAPAKLIEQSLRDSLDHLKLTVDSMNFREGDVAGLLGGLRYRLAPRLQAAGLSLDWQVAALPVWSLGSIDHLGQLQFIVFEAISNALQHAGASALLLSATHEEATIVLRIEDNGRGFAPAQEGKGLTGMRQRARSIGADIQWENLAQGGCRVCVRLPLRGVLL
jgi:signal transduction histidine kinase